LLTAPPADDMMRAGAWALEPFERLRLAALLERLAVA
jgi:hypothetical protein